jgi:hypothetical protein
MRIWTIHPAHLDPAGLVALWRETLLAQAVLLGRTRGYTHHPQLVRFRAAADPVAAVATYLRFVQEEATRRGYSFDASRIHPAPEFTGRLPETRGQLLYEWGHLGRKLAVRSPEWYAAHHVSCQPSAHPLFRITAGNVRAWERT